MLAQQWEQRQEQVVWAAAAGAAAAAAAAAVVGVGWRHSERHSESSEQEYVGEAV